VQQSLSDFLPGMHGNNQQTRLYRMPEMPMASRLTSAVPTVCFQNAD
jgi:hypothetical protein